jgi:hypothetical protein
VNIAPTRQELRALRWRIGSAVCDESVIRDETGRRVSLDEVRDSLTLHVLKLKHRRARLLQAQLSPTPHVRSAA